MNQDITAGLNAEQKEGVLTTEGPVLIIAGAGSGKTRVITHRIAYILEQKLANPENILAVTFTNKAAKEMRGRVAAITGRSGSNISLPFLGTFHSICVRILKVDGVHIGLSPAFSIYDSDDQLDLIKQAMKKLDLSFKEFNPRTIQTYISSAKNELIKPAEYVKYAQGYFQEIVAKVYPVYQGLLEENNALDFDDLIGRTVDLLKNNGTIRDKYQRLFKYIVIDEYQDTNQAQYSLIKLLINEKKNLCVVGDEDQSIYKFRGATIENILNFEVDYPEAKVIKLEQNYRSTQNILDAAHEVIKHNTQRKDKKLWTDQKEGNKIHVYQALDEQDEGHYIAGKILEQEETAEISLLYRTNAQSRALEEVLLRYKIPYRLVGGTRFYSRKEIKDVIAYLRTIYNPDDDLSLIRIINTPTRKLGAKTITDLQAKAEEAGVSIHRLLLENEEVLPPALLSFIGIIKDISTASKEMNVFDLITFVIKRTGYIEWLDDGTEENLSRIENIKELLTVAYDYKELEASVSLENFLEDISLIEQEQEKTNHTTEDSIKVTMMTIHAAKGLEFDHVFIAGMEESLFPHSRSYTDPSEMEEERRLAYVAITRAKKSLFITHAERRRIWGMTAENPISRFVGDIDESLIVQLSYTNGILKSKSNSLGGYLSNNKVRTSSSSNPVNNRVQKSSSTSKDFRRGDKVIHPIFGAGVILSNEEDTLLVSFSGSVGTKKLAAEYANLSRV